MSLSYSSHVLEGGEDMDLNKEFAMWQLVVIGVLSGVAVSIVKLIQAGFYLGDASAIEFYGALLTYLGYMVLGAIGAVFLVDHDFKGQKMFKGAFLMGFVAPSFFLALLSQPIPARTNMQDLLRAVPKITEWFVGSAYAQEPTKTDRASTELQFGKVVVLEKSKVEPSLGAAVWKAFGGHVTPVNYAYVIGTTDDEKKAVHTAQTVDQILIDAGVKTLGTKVIQPKGQTDFYVTVGELGTPEKAVSVREAAKAAAIKELGTAQSEDAKRAATLMLKGQVVDARALFAKAD